MKKSIYILILFYCTLLLSAGLLAQSTQKVKYQGVYVDTLQRNHSAGSGNVIVRNPLKADSLLTLAGYEVLDIDTITVATPTGLSAVFYYDEGNYVASGYSHNLRVYAFKILWGDTIYSSSYATLASPAADDESEMYYNIAWTWDAVSGADGYKVFGYDTYYPHNYEASTITTTIPLYTDGDPLYPAWIMDTSLYPKSGLDTTVLTVSQKIMRNDSQFTTFGVHSDGSFGIVPTSTGSYTDLFRFYPWGQLTAPTLFADSVLSTYRTKFKYGLMSPIISDTNSNINTHSSNTFYAGASHSSMIGFSNYLRGSYNHILGYSDTIENTSTNYENYILGRHNTITGTTAYGNWIFGQYIKVNKYGSWILGADDSFQKKVIPFEGAIVFLNENVRHWLSNPMGLYTERVSFSTSSPHVRDTVGFEWSYQKLGSADDAVGYGTYYLNRRLTTNGHGDDATSLNWLEYRLMMAFNHNGYDDIHFNFNANDLAKRGYGQVTIDNGQFGVMHGSTFTAGAWDSADSANVFHWSNHFYGNTQFDSTVNINTLTLNTSLDTAYNNSVSRIIADYPLSVATYGKTNSLSLGYNATNLKLTSNALNTIQDIATTSSPQFTALTLTGSLTLPNSNTLTGNAGSIGFNGGITAGGNIGLTTASNPNLLIGHSTVGINWRLGIKDAASELLLDCTTTDFTAPKFKFFGTGDFVHVGNSYALTVGDKHASGSLGETKFYRQAEDANGIVGIGAKVESSIAPAGGNQGSLHFYTWNYGVINSTDVMTLDGNGNLSLSRGTFTLPNSNTLTGNSGAVSFNNDIDIVGRPYGELFLADTGATKTLTNAGEYYTLTNFSQARAPNNCTITDSTITVLRAGTYLLTARISAAITNPNEDLHFVAFTGTTGQTEQVNTESQGTYHTSSDNYNSPISGLLRLSANDVVKLKVKNITSAGKVLTIHFASFVLTKVN